MYPEDLNEEKMVGKYHSNEEWCPECGHLLLKKKWDCPFCGWSIHDLMSTEAEVDSWDNHSTVNGISYIDRELDRLINTL